MPEITTDIHPAFQSIIGQTTAKSSLSMSIAGVGVGNELIQPLFLGPAGVGKTEIADAYGKAIANELNCPFIEIGTPKDIRNVDEFNPIFEQIIDSDSFVIRIDECHEIEPSKVSHGKLIQWLRKGTDRQNEGKAVQIADRVYIPNRKKKVIILATNHPEKMDAAIVSRFSKIDLALYNAREIRQIAENLFQKNGLVPENDTVLNRISAVGRGTARPIVSLMNDYLISLAKLNGDNVVTVEMLMLSLKNSGLFPSGLDVNEVSLLSLLCERGSRTKQQALAFIPNLIGNYNKSIAYLQNWKFVEISSTGALSLTPLGRKYIKSLKEHGFMA